MVFQNNQRSRSSSCTQGYHWKRMLRAVQIPWEMLKTGLQTPHCSAEVPSRDGLPAPVLWKPPRSPARSRDGAADL